LLVCSASERELSFDRRNVFTLQKLCEELTEDREQNTDIRELEVELRTVLIIASGVKEVSADHPVAIMLFQ